MLFSNSTLFVLFVVALLIAYPLAKWICSFTLVITTYDKDEDKILCYMKNIKNNSRVTKRFPSEEVMQKYIDKHPVILLESKNIVKGMDKMKNTMLVMLFTLGLVLGSCSIVKAEDTLKLTVEDQFNMDCQDTTVNVSEDKLGNFLFTYSKDSFTVTDKVMRNTFLALEIVDWLQTRQIAKNPDQFYEKNPILGEHPSVGKVDAYFATSILLNLWLQKKLDEPYRKIWMTSAISMELYFISSNIDLGIKVQF